MDDSMTAGAWSWGGTKARDTDEQDGTPRVDEAPPTAGTDAPPTVGAPDGDIVPPGRPAEERPAEDVHTAGAREGRDGDAVPTAGDPTAERPATPGPTPSAPPAAPAPPAPRSGPGWGALIATAVISALLAAGLAVAVDRDDSAPQRAVPATGRNTNLAREGRDIQAILARVQPAVVSIRTSSFRGDSLFGVQPVRGAGTGMLITPDGQVLTNAHVVNGATSIKVTLFNETEARDADLLGSDPAQDVAIIKIRDARDLPTVVLGDSSRIEVGDEVVAIGNALALPGGPSVTTGIVSAKDRAIDAEDEQLSGLIQTDAAINPGNSGGPLVDATGEVIGMNTAIRGDAQNIGFAIAINSIKPMLDDLAKGTGPVSSTAFLGVTAQTLTPEIKEQFDFEVDKGAIVVEVAPGSPAENAGLRRADVITRLGDREVETADQLVSVVREHKPGDKLELVWQRGGTERRATITLGSRPVSRQR